MGKTVSNKNYLLAFLTTTLLATGGYMLMPFGSDFSVRNLGITNEQIPLLYLISGIFTLFLGPLAGVLSDKIGKYKVFVGGSILTMIMVAIYTNLGVTPLALVIAINVLMFAGVMARMYSAAAGQGSVHECQLRHTAVCRRFGGFCGRPCNLPGRRR
jgi:predicted MFS family arabinose efflux permease